MLELAILGLLKERSMHGYQLSKRLTDALGGLWKVSYGSLYPALKRLEREGAVEPVFAKDDVGRRKNVYRITAKGEALFAELLQEAAPETWEDNRFRVRLAFFRYLKPRLSEIKTSLKNYRERIDAYALSLMSHGAEATERDIAWLDGLIETERRQVRDDAETAAARSVESNDSTRPAERKPRVRRRSVKKSSGNNGGRPRTGTPRRTGATVRAKERAS